MKNYSPDSTETILADTSSAASQLHAELDEMRRRLAALEARAPAHANPTVGRKEHWRATPKRLALMIAGVMLAGAAIVFGQSAVESLFVSKDGNVGVGTSAPRARLDVFGGGVKIGATSDVIPAAGKELVLSPLSGTTTGITFQHNQIDSVFLKSDGASRLTSLGANAGTFLTIDNRSGNVGLGTTAPTSRLSIIDTANSVAGQQIRIGSAAGANDYTLGRNPTTGYLDFSGSQSGFVGYTFSNGNVGIGTTTPRAKLDVAGTIISKGRYQRDDAAETTYELSPRYHLSLTAPKYAGSTRQIPQQVIIDLCGDQDGCQFRLGMTRWDNDTQTETASITGLFYYSTIDGHWRTSMLAQVGKDAKNSEAVGVDGNRITEHAVNAWDTCYFTDAPYYNKVGMRDEERGMYLLVWTGYTNANRTCELTLID